MGKGFTTEAARFIGSITKRFRAELEKMTMSDLQTEQATPDDVLEALDVIMNCAPNWATKDERPQAIELPPRPTVPIEKHDPIDVHIRWMIRRDMAEVLEIEHHSFEFPWSEDDFIRCLRQRSCIGQIAEFEERVIAFMIYELLPGRLQLLNFAVHREFRGRTVARQLVDKLQRKLSVERRNRIDTEIRESNTSALLCFRQLGFKAVKILKAFYNDTDEDAIQLQYRYVPNQSNVV